MRAASQLLRDAVTAGGLGLPLVDLQVFRFPMVRKQCVVRRNHTWNSEFRPFHGYRYTVGYTCVTGLGRKVMSPRCRPHCDILGVHCRQRGFDLMAFSTDVVGLRDPILRSAASVLQWGPLTKRTKEVYCNTTSTAILFLSIHIILTRVCVSIKRVLRIFFGASSVPHKVLGCRTVLDTLC